MRNSLFRPVMLLLFVGSFGAAASCGGSPDSLPSTSSELGGPTPGSDKMDPALLYDESSILDFKLTFTAEQWAMFEQIHNNPPPDDMRDTYTKVYVHCGFEALGMKFPDAACRPKANPDNWADELKPQLVISFNEWDEKGRFFTLRKINLEASPYALAPLNDRIGLGVMRQAGIKASRCNHVRVYKNDALLGLYMNIEAVDKEFLQSRFDNSDGNLYGQGYKLQTNTKNPDVSRLTTLQSLIENEPLNSDHTVFFNEIETMVDIPEVLAETAAEVVLPVGDNWANGGTNYYYYDDPASAKFVLLPWDFDLIINAKYAPPDANPYTFWGAFERTFPPNKLLQLLYQRPAWKQMFEDNLVNVRDRIYSLLPTRIDQVCAQIRDAFIADTNHAATLSDFDMDCANHKSRIVARIAYLQSTLGR